MENTSAKKLWETFLLEHPEFISKIPLVDYFGDNEKDTNQLSDLIGKNIKQATTHSLLGLQSRNEPLPKVGDFLIVTNWEGTAKCIIRTTSVKMLPYFAIHEAHARLEGEGDKSLAYWRKVHWAYYTRELAVFGKEPKESMIVVFERFIRVF